MMFEGLHDPLIELMDTGGIQLHSFIQLQSSQ